MSTAPDNGDSNQVEFELIARQNAPEVYADGISQMMIGHPVSKVTFHSVLDAANDGGKEMRKAKLLLTIPTASLLETALIVIQSCLETENALVGHFTEQQNARLKLLMARAKSLTTGAAESRQSDPAA